MRTFTRTASLAVAISDDPPSEFRLFKAGWNDTEKGRFLFDASAAASVMAAAASHGIDKMLDLEHLSLDTAAPNFDPDARAWFNLELRTGELWAVRAKWTEDGARRLRQKTQRYVSPVFDFDPATKRILRIINVALTALPATHATPALVAASTRRTPARTPVRSATARIGLYRALGLVVCLGHVRRVRLNVADPPDLKSAREARRTILETVTAIGKAIDENTGVAPETLEGLRQAIMSYAKGLGVEPDPMLAIFGELATSVEIYDVERIRGALAALAEAVDSSPAPKTPAPFLASMRRRRLACPLTPRELATCKAAGCDPIMYARNRAAMLTARDPARAASLRTWATQHEGAGRRG